MSVWLIRRPDQEGSEAQDLLEAAGETPRVVFVEGGNGNVPAVVLEDGKRFEGMVGVRWYCQSISRDKAG